jgi:flagellar motor switch protein FliN/FliY
MVEATETAESTTEEQQDQKAQAQSVEFSEATDNNVTEQGTSLDILLDMNAPITVALGRKEISIQQLLQLGPGSVLKLDKSIDAPVDLYLKDTRFATGTIVVVDDRFAVRIKEILGTGKDVSPNNN